MIVRKVILVLSILTCFSASALAQFILEPRGFVSQADTTKTYVVFHFDNVDKATLYNKSLAFFNSVYRSPQDVLSSVENESINIHAIEKDAIGIPYKSKIDQKFFGKYAVYYNLRYSYDIQFREGRIRIAAPSFSCYRIMNGGSEANLLLVGRKRFLSDDHIIFNTAHELKGSSEKEQLENFFNGLFSQLGSYIQGEGEDDW